MSCLWGCGMGQRGGMGWHRVAGGSRVAWLLCLHPCCYKWGQLQSEAEGEQIPPPSTMLEPLGQGILSCAPAPRGTVWQPLAQPQEVGTGQVWGALSLGVLPSRFELAMGQQWGQADKCLAG